MCMVMNDDRELNTLYIARRKTLVPMQFMSIKGMYRFHIDYSILG